MDADGEVLPEDEAERMAALLDLDLLDTLPSESFDRITRMAGRVFGVPMSAVSLTDRNRQWFKSSPGVTGRELPRFQAPCAEVTRSKSALVIPDLQTDERFGNSPLAGTGIRFYAGAPLITREGHVLGAMCVLDRQPHNPDPGMIDALRDLAAMVMHQIELEHNFGRVDPLSGLANRHQLVDDLDDQIRMNAGEPFVAVMIDVADQTQVNDMAGVLGATYIDELVRASSRVLKDALGRRSLYQIGLASYLAVLSGEAARRWRDTVDMVAAELSRPVAFSGIPIMMNPVFGVSPFVAGQSTPRDTLRTAICAAGDARAAGLGFAVYSPASDEANRRRFHLLGDIRSAFTNDGQLRLVYQPRIDVKSGRCCGVEALLRWKSPRLGEVSPAEFIPLVEQTALARPVTEWVVTAALDQVAAWRKSGTKLRASINVSGNNLQEADFASRLEAGLAARALPPDAIEIELTESALAGDNIRVMQQLYQLRELGVEIAIDDFGTGYSSFSYLRTIPAQVVKLDQSFIRSLDHDETLRLLVRSMISMAHDLGFRVVAEV